jgi:hypothetical protein
MSLRTNMAVRLRIDNTLLYIDSIDEESGVAICRKLGSTGPEGDPEVYFLDALRENVIRSPRQVDAQSDHTIISRCLCSVGLHRWIRTIVDNREPLGSMKVKLCKWCGVIRFDD